MATAVESGAQGVRWDLTPLAPSEEAMRERLDAAVADAAAFVERWPVESLETIEPTGLRALLGEDRTWHRSQWLQWLHSAFARVRSGSLPLSNPLQTDGFAELTRTGANARQDLRCRRSWVRVP